MLPPSTSSHKFHISMRGVVQVLVDPPCFPAYFLEVYRPINFPQGGFSNGGHNYRNTLYHLFLFCWLGCRPDVKTDARAFGIPAQSTTRRMFELIFVTQCADAPAISGTICVLIGVDVTHYLRTGTRYPILAGALAPLGLTRLAPTFDPQR